MLYYNYIGIEIIFDEFQLHIMFSNNFIYRLARTYAQQLESFETD